MNQHDPEFNTLGSTTGPMAHTLNQEERVGLTELQDRLAKELGRRPHPHTVAKAVLRGMPCEPDPFVPQRRLYPWFQVLAWIEDQRKKSAFSAPLRAALRG
jgi:hypothetical protein